MAAFGLLLSTGGLALNPQPGRAHAAGIVVTSLADTLTADGQCTLREALANAQADSAVHADCAGGAGFDVVTFSLSGVIALASPLPQLDSTGGAITIDGVGQAVTVDGGGAVVNLHGAQMVVTGSSFTANTALLAGGTVLNGAGVRLGAAALLHVSNSTFNGNTAGQDPVPWGNGGALVNQGTGTFSATTFESNHASQDGGTIYNRWPLTITNSTLRGNTALDSGAGLKNNGGAVVVIGSTFTANDGRGEGGGGLSQDGGSLTMATAPYRATWRGHPAKAVGC